MPISLDIHRRRQYSEYGMSFFQTIADSIYSPDFYATMPKKSFGGALKYFLLLSLLLALVRSAVPAWNFVSVVRPEIDTLINRARVVYPPELELQIRDGMVTSNVQEPYSIPLPMESDQSDDRLNLAVIDTKTPFSAAQFDEYHTIAWVAKDTIFIRGDSEMKTYDLSDVSDFTVNKALIDSFLQSVSPWFNLITPLALAGIFFMMGMIHVLRLVYLLFLAFLIWIVMKMISKPLSYGQSYTMGMYAMTLGLLAELAFDWTNFQGFPFMFTLITLAVITGNFISSTKKT